MSGIKTVSLSETEKERLRSLYVSHRKGQSLIRTDPGNWVLPSGYQRYKEVIFNLKLRKDDTFILTWAKNGTTWTQEMVWCIQNNCDFEKARKINTVERVPFLEGPALMDFVQQELPENLLEKIESMPSKRVIKSHLHYDLLPPSLLAQCKVVTCIRNPKDTLVSFYHHEQLIKSHNYDGDFEGYFDLFMDGLVFFSSYWKYTVDAWGKKDHPNVCLLFFEDLKKDLAGCIRKVSEFLQKDLNNNQIDALVEHLSFKKMKENASKNEDEKFKERLYVEPKNKDKCFYRKGEVGDWKNLFTEKMNERMDKEIEKHFKGIELEFRYD